MKQDDGVTLIELLATISISVIFVGVLFLMFSQVNFEWNSSTQSYFDKTQARTTLDTIEKYLVDSPVLVYVPISSQSNEIRFRYGSDEYKAIVYENGTITLYTFTGTPDDLTINYDNSNANYSNGLILAKNVSGVPIYQVQGNTLSEAKKYNQGQLINIQIPFTYLNVGTNGRRTPQTQTLQATVKLLLDHYITAN